MGSLWHPFAQMGSPSGEPLVIDRAEGVWIWDESGKRYIDGSAALWYSNLGHGRTEIAEVVSEQLRRLDAFPIFGDYANRPALELADRLERLAPWSGGKTFFGSGGGDAIETAAKLARSHFALRGEGTRVHLISRQSGYHGTHGYGTSLSGISANLTGWGPLDNSKSVVDRDSPAALEAEIERRGPESVAAFFCEPVIGAGGVFLPAPGYIEDVAEICARHGVLFIADCVICGFGRLGTWLGIDRWPVAPDMVALAKGITSGYLPLGALLVSPTVASPYFNSNGDSPMLRHGPTYAGHPACCAAGNAALDIYEREDLIGRGAELESALDAALAPLREHESIGAVRSGLGLIAGLDLAPDILAEDEGAVGRWRKGCRAEGLLLRGLGNGLAVSPPLPITEEEIEMIADALLRGLDAV